MEHTMNDYSFRAKDSLVGAQMLFVAFGALVLVPLLTGLDPNVALFTSGVGTLIFQLVTKRSVPIYLASSFAFIAPIIYGVKTWGIPSTLCGLAAAGVLYLVFAALIKIKGKEILEKILPPIVTSPVIMVIGLVLTPVAINMATGKTADGATVLFPQNQAVLLAVVALLTTSLISLIGKGIFKFIPILCGIAAGYILSLFLGVVDFSPVMKAPWFAIPSFTFPKWNWSAIIYIVPVAIAPAIEHVGDIVAIGSIAGKDYIKDPGIHRTMAGDGLATIAASLMGGPPNTTYSEVSGAVALTRCFNPGIMTWSAIFAILFSFSGKLGAALRSIPSPVMGGVMILLFGAIAVVGLSGLVRSQVDVMKPRNLVIIAIILVFGIGGMCFSFGKFAIKGIGLAGIVGVLLNLLLPGREEQSQKDSV
ncbi:MAG: uracil-xanthine permease family protein [Candidatus Eremiobacteraeota bacterium]|nr:uracil-xanthine permease family protein [Candidatus Eremiobacteraeota bacterium]